MARFYGIKIRNNEITLEQVPKLWRAGTEKWFKDNPVE